MSMFQLFFSLKYNFYAYFPKKIGGGTVGEPQPRFPIVTPLGASTAPHRPISFPVFAVVTLLCICMYVLCNYIYVIATPLYCMHVQRTYIRIYRNPSVYSIVHVPTYLYSP